MSEGKKKGRWGTKKAAKGSTEINISSVIDEAPEENDSHCLVVITFHHLLNEGKTPEREKSPKLRNNRENCTILQGN